MDMKTFKEWSSQGYRVHKGSKASSFRDGVALFDTNSVYLPKSNTCTSSYRKTTDYGYDDVGHKIVEKDGKFLNHTTGNYQNSPVSILDVLAGM